MRDVLGPGTAVVHAGGQNAPEVEAGTRRNGLLTKILKSGDCERDFDDILRASRVRKLRPRSGAEAAPQAPLGGKLRRVD